MKKLFAFCFSVLFILFADAQNSRKWATYLGGAADDFSYEVATDASGNVYITGYTVSTTGIATTGAHKTAYAGGAPDAFLQKFDSNGVRLWGTYYGGTGDDQATSIAVDQNTGDVYIAGITYSASGIASGGFDAIIGSGSSAESDAFLVKFNSAGVRQWGTYYGGTGDDEGHAIAIDAQGNVYLAGQTGSATTNQVGSGGHQTAYGGSIDAFLVKFNSSGARQWGTYYGGTDYDGARGLVTDTAGNVYMAGHTASGNGISTITGFQSSYAGGRDAFLIKFNSAGTRVWGTFYGGIGYEEGHSVAIDPYGDIYFSGIASSVAPGVISTTGSHQPLLAGGTYDAFLTKFNPSGARIWGTYYGGTGFELFSKVATDNAGAVYLGGFTQSTSGIASGGFQNTYGGSNDGYVAKFTSAGTRVAATYFGGSGIECTYASGLATDRFGNIYLTGETASTSSIASGGHQNTFGGGTFDGFLVKFSGAPMPCVGVTIFSQPKDSSVCLGSPVSFSTVALGDPVITYQWKKNGVNIGGATNSTYTINSVSSTDTGSYTVVIRNPCDSVTSSSARLTVNTPMIPNVTAGDTIICLGDSTQVCAATIFVGYAWNNGNTNQCFYADTSGSYAVTTTDVNGCTANSNTVTITRYPQTIVTISAVMDTLSSSSAVSYQWYYEGNEINGAIDSTYIATQDGNYSVEVTDANGCVAMSDNFYYSITGVNDSKTLSFSISPNPVTFGRLLVNSTSLVGERISCLDMLGREVFTLVVTGNSVWVDVSSLASGPYFIKMKDGVQKFVKQ